MSQAKDLKEVIDSANWDQAEVIAAARDLESAKVSARARLSEVKELILAGQTTGDPIRDYAILAHNDLRGVTDHIYRDLAERVAAHPGELVLVVCGRESRFGCSGFGGEAQVIWYNEYQLGILEQNVTGISIELKRADDPESHTRWSIPTARILSGSDRPLSTNTSKEQTGAITLSWRCDITTDLLPRISPDLDHDAHQDRVSERRKLRHKQRFIDILIGDDEVLAARTEYPGLSTLCDQLGVSSPERTLF